jgi:anaerobic selenocysteine-containing dehydrogenase
MDRSKRSHSTKPSRRSPRSSRRQARSTARNPSSTTRRAGRRACSTAVGLAFWRLFGGCTTTYGDLCWPAGLEATRLTLGDNSHNAPWDLERPPRRDLGKERRRDERPPDAHVDRALENGGTLVVIDPRRTETAERADLLLQLRPGTDGALALALGHVLVRDGGSTASSSRAHVLGYDEWASSSPSGPPERAAAVCGLPAATIEQLAHARRHDAGPSTIVPGFGMQRFTNSGQAMRAMLALLAVTGTSASPAPAGCTRTCRRVFSHVKDPLDFYPPDVPDGVVRVSISTARLGRDMLEQNDPPLRVAWVERGNPIPQNPETHAVLEAFRALDFRVVVEEFMTDTAREADIVLPAKNLFEQTDVIGAYWHPYLQIRQKVLTPPPEVHPETEIYRALGRKLGIAEEQLAATIPGPSDDAVEAWLAKKLAPFDLTLEQLRKGPVLSPQYEEVAFASTAVPDSVREDRDRQRGGEDALGCSTSCRRTASPRKGLTGRASTRSTS